MSPSERQAAFNRISSKVLDFVLCDPNNLAIIAAIELDDSSHKRNDRISDAVDELGSVADIRELFIGFQGYLYAEEAVA